MKSLSTTKLHNFLRSTSFILTFSPSEVVYKILEFQIKNLLIKKIYNILRSTTFILVTFHPRLFENFEFKNSKGCFSKSCQLQIFMIFQDLQSFILVVFHLTVPAV
jgi:hypothetical protein